MNHHLNNRAWRTLLGGLAIVLYCVPTARAMSAEELEARWPERSQEARFLLSYMEENRGKKMLTSTIANVNYNTNEAEWVYQQTGKYPAINCIDYIHYCYSSPGGWIDYSNQSVWRNWVSRRGVMAAMWHWNQVSNNGTDVSCTPGTEPKETSFRPSDIFDPTSEGYKKMIADIDQVARWMKPMAQQRVPILWRPLHEAQGNWSEAYPGVSWHKAWFWWGIDGPEALVEIWHVMYDRMVHKHGLTNLIWVFSAGDSKKWYPGDDEVDIVTYDFYNQSVSGMRQIYTMFQRNYPGKLYAIAECGNIPKVSELWRNRQYWSYVMPWYDYATTNNMNSEAFKSTEHSSCNKAWWDDALAQDFIVTRDNVPNFRNYTAVEDVPKTIEDKGGIVFTLSGQSVGYVNNRSEVMRLRRGTYILNGRIIYVK